MEKRVLSSITAPREEGVVSIMRMYYSMDRDIFMHRMERIDTYISRQNKDGAIAAYENGDLIRVSET